MEHGGDVWRGGAPESWLDFSANLRPEGPPDWVKAALAEGIARARYYPDPAMRAARSGLAAYAGVGEARLLPTAGGVAAIELALSLSRGDVYVGQHAFSEYRARAGARGRRVRPWRGRVGPGSTLVLCNPDNPTGRAMPREEVLSILERVRDMGGELLVDEAFVDFCPEVSVRRDAGPGLTVAGSLTKALCIPGIRLGYVVAEPGAVRRMERLAAPWSVSAPAAAVAEALPGHLDELAEDARLNAKRRVRFARRLEAAGARVYPSEANFLLCAFRRDMTAEAARLREAGALVRTCAGFGLPGNFLRLAVRTDEENERLAALLEG